MAHGGARTRSGPPPDPTALRRDRASDKDWITLPRERTGPIPVWPLGIPAGQTEQVHWDRLWTTPQATVWEAESADVEVALYVRTLAEAEIPGASVGIRKEARLMAENLGLTLGSLLRNRWKITDSAPPAATATPTDKTPAARPARGRSSRDRLRVVEPPSD